MDVVGLYPNIPAPPYSILVMAELEEEIYNRIYGGRTLTTYSYYGNVVKIN